jgi:hypothetical protein
LITGNIYFGGKNLENSQPLDNLNINIDNLVSDVLQNTQDIETNRSDIENLETDLLLNTADISSNLVKINTNTSNITTNTNNIASNLVKINTNTSNITTNTNNIASNLVMASTCWFSSWDVVRVVDILIITSFFKFFLYRYMLYHTKTTIFYHQLIYIVR